MVTLRSSKRGLLIDLSIVFITLLFCAIVVVAYQQSIQNLDASLVSPIPILEVSDDALLFANQEYLLLQNVYCEDSSLVTIKERYCQAFNSFSGRSFLTENTVPARENLNLNNLCEGIYAFSDENGGVRVVRSGLSKKIPLEASNKKLHFSMRADFDLTKQYLLTSADCN